MAEKSLEAHFIKCLKEGNTKKALYIVELLGDKIDNLYRGKSPLLWAKEFENDEVARVLKEKGAIEEVISKEEAERLGLKLIEKAKVGDLDAVIELIEKGADVNIKSNTGSTAMSLAKNEETRRAILDAVKKRKEKAKENEPGFMEKMKGLFGKGE